MPNSIQIKAFLGTTQVGNAFLSQHRPGEWSLDAIDVFDHSEDGGENFQRRGYATLILQDAARQLKNRGATSMSSSNEGSGTVQLLDKVFGRSNVQHRHGGEVVSFEKAVDIMDRQFGYTGSKVDVDAYRRRGRR